MPINRHLRAPRLFLSRTALRPADAARSAPSRCSTTSSDLTTHAVFVGMTGSGKTGLCLALLEEAAIDGIPAIAIDPKGDLGNLLLTFPELAPSDFRPWIDETRPRAKGMTPDDFAEQPAAPWRRASRVGRGRRAHSHASRRGRLAIYTPGSSAGMPLDRAQSFAAPPAASRRRRRRIARSRSPTTASGLLALLGIDADPVQSREHILLSHPAGAPGAPAATSISPALIQRDPAAAVHDGRRRRPGDVLSRRKDRFAAGACA